MGPLALLRLTGESMRNASMSVGLMGLVFPYAAVVGESTSRELEEGVDRFLPAFDGILGYRSWVGGAAAPL